MNRRTRVGVMILVAYACVCAVWQFGWAALTSTPAERTPAIVADYDENRYAGLLDALPPGGVVGYVTDESDGAAAARSHALTQYVVAPCLALRGDEQQQLVLVDEPPGHEVRLSRAGWHLLRNLGNGVRLFDREEP